MFGCVIPGRPVQANVQQVGATRYVIQLERAETISHIAVFFLSDPPFIPPTQAVAIYLNWPGRDWKLLGMISYEKPSAILRLKGTPSVFPAFSSSQNGEQEADSMELENNMLPDSTTSISAFIGLSVEPFETVQVQLATIMLQQEEQTNVALSVFPRQTISPNRAIPTSLLSPLLNLSTAPTADVATLYQRLLKHLYNYVMSFAGKTQGKGGEENVPVRVFQEWFKVVEKKLKHNPKFLEQED